MNDSRTRPRPLLRAWIGGILLVLGCLFIYRATLGFGFVTFDDDANFLFNRDFGPLNAARLRWIATEHAVMLRYVPVGWAVCCAIANIGGLDPFWFHLASVALHAASCVALYYVLTHLAGVLGLRYSRTIDLLPFILAAWWGWHPLRVETVAWVTTLIYLLATLFGLCCLWCFLRALDSPKPRRGLLILSLILFVAALLSHPAAVSFFPLLLACAVTRLLNRGDKCGLRMDFPEVRRLGNLLLPFAAAGVLGLATTIVVRQLDSVIPHDPTPSLAEFSVSQRIAQASAVITHFGSKILYPANLCPAYPQLEIVEPNAPRFLLSTAVCLGLIILCVLALRRIPITGLFALTALAACVPFLGLNEHPFFPSDRYTHVPMVALAIFGMVAIAESNLARAVANRALPVFLVVVLPLYMLLSMRQLALWSSDDSLYEGLIGLQTSESGRDFYSSRLLDIHLNRGEIDAARQQLNRMADQGLSHATLRAMSAKVSTAKATSDPAPYATLLLTQAQYAVKKGNARDAIERLRRAIGISPSFYQARFSLGMLLARERDARGALAQLFVLRGHPDSIPRTALNNLRASVANAFGKQHESRLAHLVEALP